MNLREQIEKEITEKVMTKLASEKVELGIIQDLQADIKKGIEAGKNERCTRKWNENKRKYR